MARGPVPKAKRARPRDEKPTLTVVAEGRSGPPIQEGEWLPLTHEWWAVWATSEQAASFSPTDWLRLRMLLPLVDLYYREPSRNLMAEIRLNEARLGGTLEDRQRMRVKIGQSAPSGPPRGRYDHIQIEED